MLAIDENRAEGNGQLQSFERCLAITGTATFQDFGNDTIRITLAINESKEKALTFLKVIWQFLWKYKPVDEFSSDNKFV